MGIRIKQLPLMVANQIAAGEVIERPASVVKELLENSLDASASHIQIEIGYGGLNLIKISDDGSGIDADDLPLAIAAHATSKINGVNDLYAIASMGFRGEALASIASVAKMTISSKTQAQEHAMMLTAKGENLHLSPCARNQGTTIEVRDLFYNVPVRKKFLKTERLEFLAIEAVVRRFAMSAPQIALTLKHNGKNVLVLPAANCDKTQFKRLIKLFGQSFAKDALYLDVDRCGMKLYGWISGPDYQRSQNDRQWVYINKRMVKDKLILHAIKQVYEPIIHPGRFPSCLLYFSLPVSEVDVNVHPTKHEVRFQQPRMVHDFFSSQLSQALATKPQAEPLPIQTEFAETTYRAPATEIYEASPKSILQFSSRTQPRQDSSWISLNKRYAIVFIDTKAHFIDVKTLHQHWLAVLLEEKKNPLNSRPLLVPLSYKIVPEIVTRLKKDKALFHEMGIAFELKEDEVLIQSLPVSMPQLDIKVFLQNLSASYPKDRKHLMAGLLASQSMDVQQLTIDEKNELIAFLQAMTGEQLTALNIGKYLSEEECQGFLMRSN